MELPSKMLDEILCRLPVKHLLRCRSVSKGWCSLIDSTPFAKKHLKKALDCNAAALIINGRGKFYLEEDFRTNFNGGDDDKDVVAVEISDPLNTRISGAAFVGAANGLVCVSKNKMNEFYIFNPSTRKWRKVPSAPAEFPPSFHMTETSLCGFGYDHLNDDYKVVKIAECYLQFRGKMAIVYSLKSNSWKRIQNVPDNNTRFFGLVKEGPFVNFNTMSVVSDGASLCALDKYPHSRIDVWVMMADSAAENSWSKALTVEEKRGTLGYESFMRPVYFSRSVLLEVDSSKLVWYDTLKGKRVKNVGVRGIPNEFDSQESHTYIPPNMDNPLQKRKQGKSQKRKKGKSQRKHQKRRNCSS